jgi:hypothetical protein
LGNNGVADEVVASAADEKVEVYMNKKIAIIAITAEAVINIVVFITFLLFDTSP